MTPEPKILELVESGLFKDAATAIDNRPNNSRSIQVLRAQIEAHIGRPSDACTTAESLLRSKLSPSDRASCYEVIGRAHVGFGDAEDGVKAIRKGIDLAAEAKDRRLEARLTARLTESLLHWVGIEPASAEISGLRRLATQSGDAHSLINLYCLIAEIHAKKRSLSRARASVTTARSLLQSYQNVWQQGRLAITAAGVSVIGSDYETAMILTEEALLCADRSGSREIRIPALANVAHIRLAQGKVDECRSALNTILAELRRGGTTEIGIRDTQMQIALATGDEELAASLAAEISRLSAELENGNSYYGFWHLLTRVRWLYGKGDAASGLSLALEAIPKIERMADRNLLERMQLLAAEGLGRVGKPVEGAALMVNAVRSNADPPLEMIAEASRVAGRLCANEDLSTAHDHFDRASLILDEIGFKTAKADVERDIREADFAGGVVSVDVRPPEAALTEAASALFELAAHPPLLATETLSLLADTHCARAATIVATDKQNATEAISAFATPGAPSPLDPAQDAVRIATGDYRDRTYEILVVPKPSASARATLLAVDRLVHAAVALAQARLQERERAALWPEPSPEHQLGLVCAAESMLDLVKTARRIAPSNVTVLITGETGTGKELFARALHQASPRHDRVFLPFNCTTVPKDVLDSQLFGYKRGAFTGAVDDAPGLIRSAAGGTLFLDEIGEMSPDVQPKLLRFLESGEILPIGESRPIQVDVRIVAATNADLDKLVAAGRFREDLYYRLNVIRLRVPPLRERREEVPLLVDYFLERFSAELHKAQLRIAEETLEYLVLYQWPGNVRQLANEIRRMAALSEPGAVLMPEHLSAEIAASRRTIPASERKLEATEVVVRIDQPASAAIEHLERALVTRALRMTRGNNEEAAKLLGLSRKGLYLKRLRFGIQ